MMMVILIVYMTLGVPHILTILEHLSLILILGDIGSVSELMIRMGIGRSGAIGQIGIISM
jgi:hypothetical protein